VCRFINNVYKTIDENNISNICRNISHKIYVQITQTYNIAKRADYLLMKQKISETDWVNLITGACDIHIYVNIFENC
jgi:hypothetical protein